MRRNVVRRLPFIALVFALSACGGGGGGGVGSTPPPVSNPLPPTPPPPPPTGSNSSLVAPLLSETFVNRNAEIALTADVSAGTGTSATTQRPLNLIYDASSSSYTLTANGRTLVFGPGDIDASKSTPTLTVYVKGTTNAASDTLTLTKAGTSGRFTYRFVGGAFWERSSLTGNSLSASARSAVYGVASPNSAVPRTGAASYAVDLIGYVTSQANPSGITGSGRLDVDFATGRVITNGTIPFSQANGFSGSFSSVASLSSSSNAFSGNFSIDAFGSYSGTLEGMFFGPAAEEVGASWTAQQNANNAASGVIIGRREGSIGNSSFAAVTNNDLFAPSTARLDYRQTSTTPQNGSAADAPLTIHYNASTGSYTLIAPDRTVLLRGLGLGAVNGEFIPVGGTNSDRLIVQGSGNYVRSGLWSSSANATGGATDIRLQNFVFGMPTASGGVPRTGEGAYVIDLRGQAADADFPNRMNFFGTGLVRTDFGAGTIRLDSSLDYREDFTASGRAPFATNGQLNGTGTISSNANSFGGTLTMVGIGNYNGNFAGQFFGPAGQEMGGTFKASDGGGGAAAGSFTGKRDDSILAADNGLLDIAQATTFKAEAQRSGQTIATELDLTWDPAAGTYRLNTKPYDRIHGGFDVTVGPNDTGFTPSPEGGTFYDRLDGGIRTSGWFLNPGPNNPRLALTYASFGDFRVTFNQPSFSGTERYLFHYGIATNAAALPKGGTASYTGLVLGEGRYSPIATLVDVTGTSAFQIDFGAMTWTGSLALRGAPTQSTAASSVIGTFGYGGQVATNGFFGNTTTQGAFGSLMGRFYGPNAAEVGANWNIGGTDPNGLQFTLQGITVGKKN